MQEGADVAAHRLAAHHPAGDLEAAARAARARADEHQQHENRLGERGPEIEVRRGKARRRDDRRHLEDRDAQIVLRRQADVIGVHEDEQRRAGDDRQIPAHLLAGERLLELLHEDEEVHVEVHAEDDHEDRDDPLNVRREAGKRVVAEAEAAGARRAERRTQRLKGDHAAQHEQQKLQNGEHDVEHVQDARGIAHLGHQLAYHGAGALRLHQVHVAAAHHRQHRQQEHQHAHAADPVREAPPEHAAVAHVLHVGEDARAGGRKARHRFKQRVDEPRDLAAQVKRQAAEHGHDNPAQRRGDEALPGVKMRAGGALVRQQEADERAQRHRDGKRNPLRLPVEERRDERQPHQRRLHVENPAENIAD